MRIRKNDTVFITKGKDRGKRGSVQRTLREDRKVVVDGVNMITRHTKSRPGVRQSGIVQQEAPISLSNVMLICINCGKPTRIGSKVLEDGRRARMCKACGEEIS